MELNITKQAAISPISPSPFGMSACGHATAMTSALPMTAVVRERRAIVKGDMGLAVPAYFTGTSAWRPPTS